VTIQATKIRGQNGICFLKATLNLAKVGKMSSKCSEGSPK
jgi:hypothetical protein